jgi:hypothetical protein
VHDEAELRCFTRERRRILRRNGKQQKRASRRNSY